MSFRKCLKPFPGIRCSKKMRKVSPSFLERLPDSINKMIKNQWICSSCYLKISLKRIKIENVRSLAPESNATNITADTTEEESSEKSDESDLDFHYEGKGHQTQNTILS